MVIITRIIRLYKPVFCYHGDRAEVHVQCTCNYKLNLLRLLFQIIDKDLM